MKNSKKIKIKKSHIGQVSGSWDGEERHVGRFPFLPAQSAFFFEV
jgi:hypothetical protein